MKISPLLSGYKTTSRLTRPAHIKNDTHYLYTTEKYVVEIVYHSSMFYAPDFYKVSVKRKSGEQVWSGGDAIFLVSLFRSDFLSDAYDLMVLIRVNSTENPDQMQIVLVDLKTGQEEALTHEGNYSLAGHFISFNAIYYADSKGIHCNDYDNKNQFMLHDVLNRHFSDIQTWGTCAIKDCILVINREQEQNVCLFNLVRQQIEDRTTLHWDNADSVHVAIGCVVQPSNSIVSVSYSDRQASGALKHRGTENFEILF